MAASVTLVKPLPAVWSQRRQQARIKPRGAALCSCGHQPHVLVFELGMGLLPSVAPLGPCQKDAHVRERSDAAPGGGSRAHFRHRIVANASRTVLHSGALGSWVFG